MVVALAIGIDRAAPGASRPKLGLDSGFWGWLNALDFEKLGYGIVGLFVLTWAGSIVIWKTRRIDERWGGALQPTP